MKTSAAEVIIGTFGLVCSAGLFLAIAPALVWTTVITVTIAGWASKHAKTSPR